MTTHSILIIAERLGDNLLPATYEMVSLARGMLGQKSGRIHLAVAGHGIFETAEAMQRATGLDVQFLEIEQDAPCPDEAATAAVSKYLRNSKESYRWILLANTTRGIPLAAALAVLLPASCVPGVGAFREEGESLLFYRNFYGGKISGWMAPETEPCILLVQPGSFPADAGRCFDQGEVHVHPASAVSCKCRSLGVQDPSAENAGLQEADVVVAAGNGIGEEANLELVRQTAALFAKSAVGGSRIVCDQGWLPHSRQIGVTGTTVRPGLYIACGISGAMQHVQGMSGSGFIVSINRDAAAAIFNFSDICVVEDINEFLPALIEVATSESRGKKPPVDSKETETR
jgi:electron transfer flavoprotein alpha subunit